MWKRSIHTHVQNICGLLPSYTLTIWLNMSSFYTIAICSVNYRTGWHLLSVWFCKILKTAMGSTGSLWLWFIVCIKEWYWVVKNPQVRADCQYHYNHFRYDLYHYNYQCLGNSNESFKISSINIIQSYIIVIWTPYILIVCAQIYIDFVICLSLIFLRETHNENNTQGPFEFIWQFGPKSGISLLYKHQLK